MKRFVLVIGVLVVVLGLGGNVDAPAQSSRSRSTKEHVSENPWETPTGLALFMAQRIENDYDQQVALNRIAFSLALSGETMPALKVVQNINDLGIQADALISIASKQIELEEKEAALVTLKLCLDVAQKMEFVDFKVLVVKEIASLLVKAGDINRAFEAARNIGDESGEDFSLSLLVTSQTQSGNLQQAFQIAQQIENASMKSRAELGIALAQIERGNRDEAVATLERARQVSLKIENTENGFEKGVAFGEIAEAWAKFGDFSHAVEVAQQIEPKSTRVMTLMNIASAQIRAGQKNQAMNVRKQALDLVEEIKDPFSQIYVLLSIASRLTDDGDKQQALAVLKQSADLVLSHQSGFEQADNLTLVASAQVAAGDQKQALATVNEAVVATRQGKFAKFRALNFGRIGSLLIDMGEFAQAVDVVQQIRDLGFRKSALSEVAFALATEPIPEKNGEISRRRMKRSFTFEEKKLAKKLMVAVTTD